jgi:hypothetical protein
MNMSNKLSENYWYEKNGTDFMKSISQIEGNFYDSARRFRAFLCKKNQIDALISQIYFVMKLYMFRTVRLSITRSLFTVHSAMVYVTQVCRQLSSRTWSCSKDVWHMPLLSVQWKNSWWWTDELSETCRFSWKNKFVKFVHLFGFITKKFVTTQDHMNVKKYSGMLMETQKAFLSTKLTNVYSTSLRVHNNMQLPNRLQQLCL